MTPIDQPDNEEHFSMPFLDHLEELRWRLLKSIIAVIVTTAAALYFSDELFRLIVIPLGEIKLHVTEITASFYAYLKVTLITGVIVALPVVFYQLWSFIGPGLYASERRAVLPMVVVSTLLFVVGAGFCWILVLPLAIKLLTGFSEGLFVAIITVDSYISFAGLMLIAFGLAFQLPVLAYFLASIGILGSRFLSKGRRFAIVIMLIVGAILTPADVFTQLALAVPLYLLYEVSIIIVRIVESRRRRAEQEESNGIDNTDLAG